MQQTHNRITLLTTNAIGFPFIVRHKAIKFTDENNTTKVIHRTTSGVEILSYNVFMKERHIINHKAYPLRREFDAESLLVKYNHEPFNWMSNNCEDFTSDVIKETCGVEIRPRSAQRTNWIIVLGVILILMILIKR